MAEQQRVSLNDLIRRFKFDATPAEQVVHPLSDARMPSGGIPFIVQPLERGEIPAAEFARRLSAGEKRDLRRIIESAGRAFWGEDSALIAVGTSVFPESYWSAVRASAVRGAEKEFEDIARRGGEDLDLTLLCENLQSPLAADWLARLSKLFDGAGIKYAIQDKFENGAFYYAFTMVSGVDPDSGEPAMLVDEKPYRHKFQSEGGSIMIDPIDGERTIHIRQNFAADAAGIIEIERAQSFCFSELFRAGRFEDFLSLL